MIDEKFNNMLFAASPLHEAAAVLPSSKNLESRIGEINVTPSFDATNEWKGAFGDSMGELLRAKVDIGYDANGKPECRWVSGKNTAELAKRICELKDEYHHSIQVQQVSNRKKFEEYAEHWYTLYKDIKIHSTTKHPFTSQLRKHIYPFFGDMYLDEITTDDVQRFLNGLSYMASKTINDIRNRLDQILESALDDGLITKNPNRSKKIFVAGRPSKKRKALTDEEVADIISNIPKLEKRNDRMFMSFLMLSCLRRCEIYGLRWEDIDVANKLIHVRQSLVFSSNAPIIQDGTKTAAGVRDVPLHPPMLEALKPLGTQGLIFVRDGKYEGEPYTEMTHKRGWDRIKQTIDVHGMIPYEGRHTYLTAMDEVGVKPGNIQLVAGHTSFNTTKANYIHPRQSQVQAAGIIMQEHFEKIGASIAENLHGNG